MPASDPTGDRPACQTPPWEMAPRAAYIHVPFCRHRCGYCNFSVLTGRDELMDRFVAAIEAELRSLSHGRQEPPRIDTLFIGGGTPTHLPAALLERLLRRCRESFRLETSYEWTVEANPEDITSEKLDVLQHAGVNRVSLGVQSFCDRKLRVLERGHRGDATGELIERVAERVETVSIDLIFAAPGETLEDWERDLRTATSLPIQHVSTYALTYEKGTSYWSRRRRGDLNEIDDDEQLAMYQAARRMLAPAGLKHYEISSFARSGSRCRHNLTYWTGRPWYAAGPGAAAFVSGRRTVNHRSPTGYLKRIERGESPVVESETLSRQQAAREWAAFGIRVLEGIDLDEIESASGVPLRQLAAGELEQLRADGLVDQRGSRLWLTDRGIRFADTVSSAWLG